MPKRKSFIGWTWKNWQEDFDNDTLMIGGFPAVGIPHIYPKKPRLKNVKQKVRIIIQELEVF